MASSDTDAGEMELSSEDDQQHPVGGLAAQQAEHDKDEQEEGQVEGDVNEAEEGEAAETGEDVHAAAAVSEGTVDEAEEDSTEPAKRRSHRSSLDEGGLSFASQLTHHSRAVIEQAEESRQSMKKMAAFLKDKAELDRYYAKALKKLVDKAAPEPHATTLTSAARSTAGSHSPSSAAAAVAPSAASSSASSSFDLAMSSFRHLSLTLASNFDLLASKTDEHCLRAFSAAQQHHSRETKRLADELQRIQKQLQSLHDTLLVTKANSKRACMDYQIWMMEHREKQRVESEKLARDRAAGLAGVDSHNMFDELVATFRWDTDSIKKRTLEVDNRYIAAVKAFRSFRPQYDGLLGQLLASAQAEEEDGRKELLSTMHLYCDIQTAMFEKYVRNVRAVSAMSQQVNVRRELRAWIKQQKNTTAPIAVTAAADRALPEYVMHKGHPRYGETEEVEEKHEHEGITDDEDESGGGEDDDEEADEEEEDGQDEDEEDEEEEDDADEDEEDEDEATQAHRRRRAKRHRRRKGAADELDESEDEKTEERIVAEKVLRVFINKTIGLQPTVASHSSDAAIAAQPVDLISPTSATLTKPLPASALLPVDQSALGDGSPLDADEEQAAKAIVSTRDGRNAFATIFSSLSLNFHASHLPKSLFFSVPPDPLATSLPATAAAASSLPPVDRGLTLSRASFNALAALTTLFLDAAHTAYHIEPAMFVANVAHQIVRQLSTHTASTASSTAAAPPTAPPAVSPSDDVMRKEEVEHDSNAKPMTLLAALSVHPLLRDTRFYSSALFASLHHAFAHSSLYLHRWYSDQEQEDVERRRKAETVAMIGRYERMMRECGVKRRERRKFVEKQVRVFDLLGKDEWKDTVLQLTKRNERGAQAADEEEDDEDEEDGDEPGSPLSIEGLRELASDSEEERQNTLLKRKEEERRAMAEQKAAERRKKKAATEKEPEGGSTTATTTAAAAAAAKGRKKREEEERRKREEEEKERERRKQEDDKKKQHEEKKKSSASSFLAHSLSSLQSSWFAHRSPTPPPSADAAARDRKSSGATATAAAPVAGPVAAGTGVRIPIPVAAAVPPPNHTSPGAAARHAAVAASKAAQAPAAATGSGSDAKKAEGAAAGGEAKKKRVVRKKKRPSQELAIVTTDSQPAPSSQSEPNQQAGDVDDMP